MHVEKLVFSVVFIVPDLIYNVYLFLIFTKYPNLHTYGDREFYVLFGGINVRENKRTGLEGLFALQWDSLLVVMTVVAGGRKRDE